MKGKVQGLLVLADERSFFTFGPVCVGQCVMLINREISDSNLLPVVDILELEYRTCKAFAFSVSSSKGDAKITNARVVKELAAS